MDNLQPDWNAAGAGGVFSAYVGPPAYGFASPGRTALFDGREAGIIEAGLAVDPTSGNYEDEGLFGFQPNVTIDALAGGSLNYDVDKQTGTNPVWMTIEIDTGVVGDRSDNTVYQYVPTTNPDGWHTVDAEAGQWQKWNNSDGDTTGNPLISLSQVASDNPGLNVVRAYLRLGIGNSYHGTGSGTIAWVDKVTIMGVTYDFVVSPWYVDPSGSDSNQGTITSPFLTIQHAVDAAASGDTVIVAAGTYPETVTINKSLTLQGAQAGVDARGRTGASESIIPATSTNSAVRIAADNVTIDGFTVEGSGAAGQKFGINAAAGAPTSGVHITNTIFHNLYEGVNVQGPATNVATGLTIDKNNFYDGPADTFAQDAGVWMASAPSSNLSIVNNTFSGHDGRAMATLPRSTSTFPRISPSRVIQAPMTAASWFW